MWEIQNPVKTQTLPRTNPVRCSEKFGSVSVKTNYRSYKDFLESFNENKTSSKNDRENTSSTNGGISPLKLSESKSCNDSSSSLNSDTSNSSNNSCVRRSDVNGLKMSFGSYKEFLENYNNKKFSSVRPSLPVTKSVKSEIFIQVGGDEKENEDKQVCNRTEDVLDCAERKKSHVNGKINPVNNEQLNGNSSDFEKPKLDKLDSSKSSVNIYVNVNDKKLPVNDRATIKKPSVNGFSNGNATNDEICTRTGGKTVETIKKFNDLSKKDVDTKPITNGSVGKLKSRFSNGKTDTVPERSFFINGRTSPLSPPPEKFEENTKLLKTANESVEIKIFVNDKPINGLNAKTLQHTNCTTVVQNTSDQMKLGANIKQISEELNKINTRYLNGDVNRMNGINKDSKERKSLDESNEENEQTKKVALKDEYQAPLDTVATNADISQNLGVPPPPPPPPPMANLNNNSSTLPKKWGRVKTEAENSVPAEPAKPKETNIAAMNLAKILTESRRLKKTKSVDDALESEKIHVRKTPSPTNQTYYSKTTGSITSSSKQSSLESLDDQHHSLPNIVTSSAILTQAFNVNCGRHDNYLENKERSPSPPKQIDIQPLKSVYNGHTYGKVSKTQNTLRRTMSGPKIENTSSLLEANAKTVVQVTDKNAKIEKGDPNVKKLVYNTYRGLLGAYNNKANDMIATLPRNMVREDQGVTKQLESIALQGGLDKINGRINPNADKE